MASKSPNVKKMDSMVRRLQMQFPNFPVRIRENIETWTGKGWGVFIERQHVETTVEVFSGEPDEG
jgi:hypothetical protein